MYGSPWFVPFDLLVSISKSGCSLNPKSTRRRTDRRVGKGSISTLVADNFSLTEVGGRTEFTRSFLIAQHGDSTETGTGTGTVTTGSGKRAVESTTKNVPNTFRLGHPVAIGEGGGLRDAVCQHQSPQLPQQKKKKTQ